MKKYTKKQAEKMFRGTVWPAIRANEKARGIKDFPQRHEAWNVHVHTLNMAGFITDRQAMTWLPPAFLDQ